MDYSLKQGVAKALKYVVIFLLPQLVDWFVVAYPEWAQLTVGGLLVWLVNLLKVRFGARIP